jgi:hypothetical protein
MKNTIPVKKRYPKFLGPVYKISSTPTNEKEASTKLLYILRNKYVND